MLRICQNSVANASAKAVQWWAALHQQSAMLLRCSVVWGCLGHSLGFQMPEPKGGLFSGLTVIVSIKSRINMPHLRGSPSCKRSHSKGVYNVAACGNPIVKLYRPLLLGLPHHFSQIPQGKSSIYGPSRMTFPLNPPLSIDSERSEGVNGFLPIFKTPRHHLSQAAGQHSFGFHQLRLQPKCLEQCVEISATRPSLMASSKGSHRKLMRFVGCPFFLFFLKQAQVLLTH